MIAVYPKAVVGVKSGVKLQSYLDVDNENEQQQEQQQQQQQEQQEEIPGEDIYFICTSCNYKTDNSHTQRLLNYEDELCQDPPETYNDLLSRVLNKKIIHPQHYMYYWLIDDIAMTLALDTQEVYPTNQEKVLHSISLVKELIHLLHDSQEVTTPHSEEIIYHDRIAQLYIQINDISSAKKHYQQAYEVSCCCSGDKTEGTLELKELAENCPTTIEELMVRVMTLLVMFLFLLLLTCSFMFQEHYQNRRPNS